MILKKIFNALAFVFFVFSSYSQTHQARFEKIDVQHYSFEIHLNDSTNRIEGKTKVLVQFLEAAENCVFDLIEQNNSETGMFVESVICNSTELKFSHKNKQLIIDLGNTVIPNKLLTFEITYAGIPADGLVISENKHGQRTFFGDNWPDRAKHWLPTVDHPSDKATVEFEVYAPKHYTVISNGYLVEKKQLENSIEFTHWKEDVPLSTKLMVIGVADFVIGNKTEYQKIQVNSWVFEKNKVQGFENYKYGTKALQFFSELIGPYSYEKLAHVQSKTRYGGMENASCIFYHERTATSNQSPEYLFAHEVAHQWFGNSVTEQNWHHVWLSEGFATYLTHVYKQHFQGEEVFHEGLKSDRERVIRYSKQYLSPIIDTTVTKYIRLLNANSYQKASWFLHMLRMDLGDKIFFKGLQKYYADFQNSTALTKDFLQVMKIVSGKDLDLFFEQWLWHSGHPVLNCNWKAKTNGVNIDEQYFTINQQNKEYFKFSLELNIFFEDGTSESRTVQIEGKQKEQHFPVKTTSEIKRIILDPNTKLLFELNKISN